MCLAYSIYYVRWDDIAVFFIATDILFLTEQEITLQKYYLISTSKYN